MPVRPIFARPAANLGAAGARSWLLSCDVGMFNFGSLQI